MSTFPIRLNEETRARVLETLAFMTRNPETGYREQKCGAYVAEQFRTLGYDVQLAGDMCVCMCVCVHSHMSILCEEVWKKSKTSFTSM